MVVIPYATYLKMQTAGPVIKPEHYHIAERKTIDHFISAYDVPRETPILDVGCAVGLAMLYFRELGYTSVFGIDLDSRKVRYAAEDNNLPNVMLGDIIDFNFGRLPKFGLIYSSHCLEHTYDAAAAIEAMINVSTVDARFMFVLPYPNPKPSPAHWATPEIGLDKEDSASSVVSWFEDHGLSLIDEIVFDNYREPEIWLAMEKN